MRSNPEAEALRPSRKKNRSSAPNLRAGIPLRRGRSVGALAASCGGGTCAADSAAAPSVQLGVPAASISLTGVPSPSHARRESPPHALVPIDGLSYATQNFWREVDAKRENGHIPLADPLSSREEESDRSGPLEQLLAGRFRLMRPVFGFRQVPYPRTTSLGKRPAFPVDV